jgi:hypothetical protein
MSYNDSRSSSTGGGGMEDMLGEMALKIGLLMVLTVVIPALLIGLVGYRLFSRWSTHPRRDWIIVVAVAIVCLYIGYHFFWPLNQPGSPLMILAADVGRGLHHNSQWNGWQLVRELLPVWAMSLLLGPAAICGVALYEETRSKSPQRLALQQAQQKRAATHQASKAAARFLARKKVPEAVTIRGETALVLGVPVEGNLLDWIKQRWFGLPLEQLILHTVVIGTSGSGKSKTLLRIAVAAAKALRWQVIFIDLKGDYKAMAEFMIAMEAAGISVRLFPMEGYNGWVGTRDALLSRLLAIDNVAEVTSSGQHHYKTVRENLVEMAVNAPGGPPKSSQEFLDRLMLENGLLYDLYAGYSEQQSYLDVLLKRPQDALSAYGHYRAFFSKAHGKLDGNWSYDDCEAAYVLLDNLALPEITDGVGRFLLADFVNYTTRKPWEKRVLFVFDEAGALNVPLYNVFERVRFRQVSVMVASQDPSGLASKPGGPGVWDEVRRVLGNSAIKIVHRSEDSYEVIRRAGTVEVPDTGYTLDTSGMTTGSGTARLREELKIDSNDVLRLKAGEAFVVGSGDYERVLVAMREVDQGRFVQLYQELERRAKEEPPPLQRRQGGAPIVDSTIVQPSTHPAPSPKRQPGSTPKNTNGKNGKPPSPLQKNTDRSASPSQPKTQTPAKLPAQESSSRAAASRQGGNNADAPFPFPLPDNQPAPTQPGVLPMWQASAEEDEDLLQ